MLKKRLNPPAKRGRRNWSEAQRRVQAQMARVRRPWNCSTGPKTAAGKKISSQNALKSGVHSVRTKRFKQLMRQMRQFLAKAKAHERRERLKRRFVLAVLSGRISFKNKFFRHPGESRDPDLSTPSGFRLSSE